MNKPLSLILALSLVCGPAFAQWVEIQTFDDGMRVFADPASARRDGQTAQLTHLVRWGEPQLEPGSPPYRSTVVHTSYDCVAKRERYLASTSYSGTMGDGATIIADDDEADAWYSISAASMEDNLWKIACAAR